MHSTTKFAMMFLSKCVCVCKTCRIHSALQPQHGNLMRMGEQGGTGTHMKKQQQLPNCIATMAHHQSEVHIHVYYCIYIYIYVCIYICKFLYIYICAQSMYEIFTSNASLMCIYLIQRKKRRKRWRRRRHLNGQMMQSWRCPSTRGHHLKAWPRRSWTTGHGGVVA